MTFRLKIWMFRRKLIICFEVWYITEYVYWKCPHTLALLRMLALRMALRGRFCGRFCERLCEGFAKALRKTECKGTYTCKGPTRVRVYIYIYIYIIIYKIIYKIYEIYEIYKTCKIYFFMNYRVLIYNKIIRLKNPTWQTLILFSVFCW